MHPWPNIPDQDNLCDRITIDRHNKHQTKLKVIIVMGSDRSYHNKVISSSIKNRDPLSVNTRYADKNGYALRMYIDEDIPYLMKFRGMIFRKWFTMNDCLNYTHGLQYGHFTTKVIFTREDLKLDNVPPIAMWVDGDAFFLPIGQLDISMLHQLTKQNREARGVGKMRQSLVVEQKQQQQQQNKYTKKHISLTIEEVIQRTCERAEYPRRYVRVITQDSGNNVLIYNCLFSYHMLYIPMCSSFLCISTFIRFTEHS